MNLEELKHCPHGTELEGVILVIKVARKAFDTIDDDGKQQWWQEVVFMDVTGEMPGEIYLGTYSPEPGTKNENRTRPHTPWRSKQKIFVVEGKILDGDVRGKMGRKVQIMECRDLAPQLSWNQWNDISQAETDEQLKSRERGQEQEIRGKCLTLFIMHFIGAVAKECGEVPKVRKQDVERFDEWVDIAMRKLSNAQANPTTKPD
jgi:hypothetical protein